MDTPSLLLSVAAGIIILFPFLLHRFQRRRAPFPPGPPGIPFIGNLFQLPLEQPWIKYASWAKQYGDIVHLTAFGQHIILLNSESAVLDLLERRSAIYSDRPQLCMSGELVGWSESVPMIAYGDRHREYRKLLNEALAPRKLEELHAMEEEKAFEYLQLLTKNSMSFSAHARRLVAAIIFDISHGYTVAERDDPRMELAERANNEFALSAVPGAYLCDTLPILKYTPEWTGIQFKKDAKQFKKTLDTLRNEPYDKVKAEVVSDTEIKRNARDNHPTLDTRGWHSKTIILSAADRTQSAPETGGGVDAKMGGARYIWSRRGYYDLGSRVVFPRDVSVPQSSGTSIFRIDESGGTYASPSVQRSWKSPLYFCHDQIHRWNPVVPLALPHRLTQDDHYCGYHIPAGSIIWANSWSLLHDPTVYPAPFEFSPERFLSDNGKLNPDPRRYAFGYGRRSCPGQVLAEDILFIAIASTLCVFRIEPADASKTDVEFTSTVLSHPKELEYNLIPRSEEAFSLLQ